MIARVRLQMADRSKPKIAPSRTVPQSLANISGTAGSFTPKGVFALLRHEVLKDNATLPRSTDRAFAHLARVLNTLQWKVQGWTGPWPKEQEQLQRIAEAIWVLTEILPAQREDYAASPGNYERWGRTDAAVGARAHRAEFDMLIGAERARLAAAGVPANLAAYDANVKKARARNAEMEVRADLAAAEARARLAAFDALITAARVARELGLPLANNLELVVNPPTERWKDYAEYLQMIFHSALPGRPKAAAYRFIVAVTPAITGQPTTFKAVEAFLKKGRYRGKHKG
jgi:hypothetical protein